MGAGPLVISFIVTVIIAVGVTVVVFQYRKMLREAKNYERGLKMVPLLQQRKRFKLRRLTGTKWGCSLMLL